jgi:hypothetical protein
MDPRAPAAIEATNRIRKNSITIIGEGSSLWFLN